MNRRQFFSFAAVAPVALPMAAKAMVANAGISSLSASFTLNPASFGVWRTFEYGSVTWDTWSAPLTPTQELAKLATSFDPIAETAERIPHAINTMADTLVKLVDKVANIPNKVEAQMADDDLFELDCQGDGTLESTSDPLS
jgi:hypothetical protein